MAIDPRAPGVRAPTAPGTAETHISVVVFLGDRAYKFPKPLRFDFLDQSTVERRAAVCATEVELNRRLAPDVYLGTGELRVGGEPAEHCVVMRRMPADRRPGGGPGRRPGPGRLPRPVRAQRPHRRGR
jgi:aminoglycoside phosphotransferase family enzyme